MKTISKLHIILTLLFSCSLLAKPINSNNRSDADNQFSKIQQTNNIEACELENIAAKEYKQLDIASNLKLLLQSNTAPKFFGGFEIKFSSQFILPDTRTNRWFNRKLKI